jgi:ubiquinone/menaquinone biosynthesis C-methylase UbiE
MINKTHGFLLANLSWIGVSFIDPSSTFEEPNSSDGHPREVRVLDYACGPGTMTNILSSHATHFIGLDISEKMVEAYNESFAPNDADDGPQVNAKAVTGDLLIPTGPSSSTSGPEFFGFDLAVVGFGFHHFENIVLATERLTARLKPNGVFLIADFITHAKNEDHPAAHTVAHHGFDEEEVQRVFGGAGLVDVGVLRMPGEIWMEAGGQKSSRQVFLAKGRKLAP